MANSTFLYYAVAQLQYQLTDDDDDGSGDDHIRPAVDDRVDDTNPLQTDDRPPPLELGTGQGQALVGRCREWCASSRVHLHADSQANKRRHPETVAAHQPINSPTNSPTVAPLYRQCPPFPPVGH